MTVWDPGQYLKFGGHRQRPALELLMRAEHPAPHTIYDLGCGTGEMARIIAARWPAARVVGADASADMLAKAAQAPSRIEWKQLDLTTWTADEPIDVLYSNALLQWLPNHDELFPRLAAQLAPGGVMAVQMPLSWSEPSHRLMRETLASYGPPELCRQLDRKWVADGTEYFDLLRPHMSELDIWETRYLQVLDGPDPVLEWVKGTALRPVLETLKGEKLEGFLADYRAALAKAYPPRGDGRTIYPFPRLFIVGRR